jgi:transglutaminase-like putative cysteine protease
MTHINIKSLLCTIALAIAFANGTYAQDDTIPKVLYTAAGIPDSLKGDANSVVRYKMKNITVDGPGDISVKEHSIVTILNEKGNDEAQEVLGYSKKYNSIGSFEMRIYNAAGEMIKKYRKSDMYDRSAVSSGSIITDERLMFIGHTIATYPSTVEVTYETNYRSSINIDSWDIQDTEQSIQDSYCYLSIKTGSGFRYLNKNIKIKPKASTDNKTDTYSWHVSNLKAIKLESGAKSWRVLPRIYFAANKFEFYGLDGDFSSWQTFGKWIEGLNADVCTLSPLRAEEIKKMTAGIKTDKEKVRFLYEYMQQSMRYVSVQLGIGGMKPFTADFVDQKKYGDCKALSNYMYALLKAVDIPANYAIINAGANAEPAEPGFARNSFNHAILCVPLKGDTTWLECTSSTIAFGKLSPFTENRRALLVTDDGGKLVNTPKSIAEDNQFNSEVQVILSADGGAKAQVKILSTGEYRDDYIGLATLKADEQKEYLIRMLNMKQPSVLDYKPLIDKDGIKEVSLDIEYDKFCDVMAGSKQFYRPRVFDLWGTTLPALDKRTTDYYFNQPMMKNCVTTIVLPEGFEVETLPANQSLKFTYGNYDIKYVYDAVKNQVISTTKFNLTNHVIPAAKYNEMQQYMDNIAKAQNKKLIIRRKA